MIHSGKLLELLIPGIPLCFSRTKGKPPPTFYGLPYTTSNVPTATLKNAENLISGPTSSAAVFEKVLTAQKAFVAIEGRAWSTFSCYRPAFSASKGAAATMQREGSIYYRRVQNVTGLPAFFYIYEYKLLACCLPCLHRYVHISRLCLCLLYSTKAEHEKPFFAFEKHTCNRIDLATRKKILLLQLNVECTQLAVYCFLSPSKMCVNSYIQKSRTCSLVRASSTSASICSLPTTSSARPLFPLSPWPGIFFKKTYYLFFFFGIRIICQFEIRQRKLDIQKSKRKRRKSESDTKIIN